MIMGSSAALAGAFRAGSWDTSKTRRLARAPVSASSDRPAVPRLLHACKADSRPLEVASLREHQAMKASSCMLLPHCQTDQLNSSQQGPQMQIPSSPAAPPGLLSLLGLFLGRHSLAMRCKGRHMAPTAQQMFFTLFCMLTQIIPVGAAPPCWAPSAGAGAQHPSAQLPEHDFL